MRMVSCCAVANASPIGCPKGYRRYRARGGRTLRVTSFCKVTPIVGTPAASIARCTRPTVWLQSPQAGVRTTASAPSLSSRRATSGAVVSMSVRTWVPSMWPMNE